MRLMLKRYIITLSSAVLLIGACTTPPKSPSAVLADTEIALTTAVANSDQMLGAACVKPASDQCGKALIWHANLRTSVQSAKATIVAARAQIASDPANANSALVAANAAIQELNRIIQAGVK